MANAPEKEPGQTAGKSPKPPRPPRGERPAGGDAKGPKAPVAKPEAAAPADAKEGRPAAAPGERAARPPRPQDGQAPRPAGVSRREARAAGAAKGAAGKPARLKGTPRLQERYRREVVPVLTREFGYKNVMQVPQLTRISVNISMGANAKTNAPAGMMDAAVGDLSQITGQKPLVTKARMSIANFNLREGHPIGVMVTLRGDRMWQFFDRLVSIALPRVRDFRGVSRNAFDGRGNYALGLREQVVFPEIDYNKIDRIRGLQINILTTAGKDEEGRRLLELLGMPFVKPDVKPASRN